MGKEQLDEHPLDDYHWLHNQIYYQGPTSQTDRRLNDGLGSLSRRNAGSNGDELDHVGDR
jgi:hypothetical protein